MTGTCQSWSETHSVCGMNLLKNWFINQRNISRCWCSGQWENSSSRLFKALDTWLLACEQPGIKMQGLYIFSSWSGTKQTRHRSEYKGGWVNEALRLIKWIIMSFVLWDYWTRETWVFAVHHNREGWMKWWRWKHELSNHEWWVCLTPRGGEAETGRPADFERQDVFQRLLHHLSDNVSLSAIMYKTNNAELFCLCFHPPLFEPTCSARFVSPDTNSISSLRCGNLLALMCSKHWQTAKVMLKIPLNPGPEWSWEHVC